MINRLKMATIWYIRLLSTNTTNSYVYTLQSFK